LKVKILNFVGGNEMSNIRELCENVSFTRIHSWRNIPKSKLNNVVINLGINNDDVILFYDSSLFENGKNGKLILLKNFVLMLLFLKFHWFA